MDLLLLDLGAVVMDAVFHLLLRGYRKRVGVIVAEA